jgi:hypothetical protein
MKAYLAAPLFCQGEKEFNLRAKIKMLGERADLAIQEGPLS